MRRVLPACHTPLFTYTFPSSLTGGELRQAAFCVGQAEEGEDTHMAACVPAT